MHFTAPEHFSVYRDIKMFTKIGHLTSSIMLYEKSYLRIMSYLQSLSEFMIALHVPVVWIDEEFTVLLLMRSLHGHSIKGLSPLFKFVVSLFT